MDLETYNQKITPFEKGTWNFDFSPKSVTLARYSSDILVEVGEMTDQINKHIYRGYPLSRPDLASEMTDVLFLWTSLARNLGFNPNDLVEASAQKFQARSDANAPKAPEQENIIFEKFREP